MPTPSISRKNLIDFAAGDLTGPEAERVARHIEAEPAAARQVNLYQLAARRSREDDATEPPPEVTARARTIFEPCPSALSNWIGRLQELIAHAVDGPALAPVGLRTGATSERVHLTFEVDRFEIDLGAHRLDTTSDTWRIRLQIDAGDGTPADAVALTVPGSNTPTQIVPVDADGMAVLECPAGTWTLHIRCNDQSIVLPKIELP